MSDILNECEQSILPWPGQGSQSLRPWESGKDLPLDLHLDSICIKYPIWLSSPGYLWPEDCSLTETALTEIS